MDTKTLEESTVSKDGLSNANTKKTGTGVANMMMMRVGGFGAALRRASDLKFKHDEAHSKKVKIVDHQVDVSTDPARSCLAGISPKQVRRRSSSLGLCCSLPYPIGV